MRLMILMLTSMMRMYLTVGFGSHQQRNALEPFDIVGGHMTGAFVIPLPIGIKGIKLHPPSSICHRGFDLGLYQAVALSTSSSSTTVFFQNVGTQPEPSRRFGSTPWTMLQFHDFTRHQKGC